MVSLARQCGTGARYDGRYRRPTGSPTPGRREPKEALESRARISRLYRSEPKLHPKLWGSLPARREDLNGLRGVRGESSGEQAHGEEAANAMDSVRRAQSTPGADEGTQ